MVGRKYFLKCVHTIIPEICKFIALPGKRDFENMIKIRNWGVLSWMTWCFQVAPVVKTPPANTGDPGSIPGSGRRPGARGGYPVRYSCLGNLTDGEAWRAPVPGVTKSQSRLSAARRDPHLISQTSTNPVLWTWVAPV